MDLRLLAPEIALALSACGILLADTFGPRGLSRQMLLSLATIGLAVSGALLLPMLGANASSFSGAFTADGFTGYVKLLLLASTLLVVLASQTFLQQSGRYQAEAVALVLLSTTGLMLLTSATELITLYISLEISSLSIAFLSAWNKRDVQSTEAGLKFFLLNALSSAILLYGMALLYGLTGQTRLDAIARGLASAFSPAVALAIAMLLAGFGFKLSVVPFQMWTPDVYEGAPTPITAYLSVTSKAAAFAVAIRVFETGLPIALATWIPLIALLAGVTMTLGNVVAMVQSNMKRMLAYSSIAQAGYMLLGLAAASDRGLAGVLFYLAAYTATNLGAFIAVIEISRRVGSERIADLAGLHQKAPGLAFALAVSLLSLAGLPPLAGFFAKIYIFWAAVESGLVWLVLLAVINSAASLYYYAQVIHQMYVAPGEEPAPAGVGTPVAAPLTVPSLGLAVAGVFVLGILSGYFLGVAEVAARSLFE